MPANDSDPIEVVRSLFDAHGALVYGESVNQLEHALQCATLAQRAGASDALVTAVLLHDVGHMIHRDAAGALQAGMDDAHEKLGAKYLARWFGPEVCEPVALHVQAKRFLCARDAGYQARLSDVSTRTLALQGGPMSGAEADVFAARPHASGAVSVRRWDDEGKQAGMQTPPLSHFLAIAGRCLRAA